MVQGRAALQARFKRIPEHIVEEVRAQMEKEAGKLVRQMAAIKPLPEIEIGWTWGDTPAGALTIGTVGPSRRSSGATARSFGKVKITIYATAMGGEFPAIARWFEFGTADRTTDEGAYRGRILANPYFYPVFRANKRNILTNLKGAVNRGFRKKVSVVTDAAGNTTVIRRG